MLGTLKNAHKLVKAQMKVKPAKLQRDPGHSRGAVTSAETIGRQAEEGYKQDIMSGVDSPSKAIERMKSTASSLDSNVTPGVDNQKRHKEAAIGAIEHITSGGAHPTGATAEESAQQEFTRAQRESTGIRPDTKDYEKRIDKRKEATRMIPRELAFPQTIKQAPGKVQATTAEEARQVKPEHHTELGGTLGQYDQPTPDTRGMEEGAFEKRLERGGSKKRYNKDESKRAAARNLLTKISKKLNPEVPSAQGTKNIFSGSNEHNKPSRVSTVKQGPTALEGNAMTMGEASKLLEAAAVDNPYVAEAAKGLRQHMEDLSSGKTSGTYDLYQHVPEVPRLDRGKPAPKMKDPLISHLDRLRGNIMGGGSLPPKEVVPGGSDERTVEDFAQHGQEEAAQSEIFRKKLDKLDPKELESLKQHPHWKKAANVLESYHNAYGDNPAEGKKMLATDMQMDILRDPNRVSKLSNKDVYNALPEKERELFKHLSGLKGSDMKYMPNAARLYSGLKYKAERLVNNMGGPEEVGLQRGTEFSNKGVIPPEHHANLLDKFQQISASDDPISNEAAFGEITQTVKNLPGTPEEKANELSKIAERAGYQNPEQIKRIVSGQLSGVSDTELHSKEVGREISKEAKDKTRRIKELMGKMRSRRNKKPTSDTGSYAPSETSKGATRSAREDERAMRDAMRRG